MAVDPGRGEALTGPVAVDLRELRRPGTGIGRWVLNALEARRALAPDVSFVAVGAHHPDAVASIAGPSGPWCGPTLNRILRAEGVGLWWSPYFKVPPLLDVPSICTVHDTIPAGIWHRAIPFIAALRHALAVAERVATVSEVSRRDLETRWSVPPARILMAPNAVGAAFRPEPDAGDAAVLAACHVASKQFLLVVSDDRPHKNVGTLARAFAGRDLPPVLVVGTRRTDLPPPLRAAPVRGDRELAALYRHARALLHPALQEGFGLPPLEAMASGTDVIVSDIPIMREIAGEAARFVAAQDGEEWFAAARSLAAEAPRTERNLAAAARYRGTATYAALWAWIRERLSGGTRGTA